MDSALEALLRDPVLQDVPQEASLQQLRSLHARALGDVLTLELERLNHERIPLAVPAIGSRVCDLRHEIQRVVTAREASALHGRHLSWRAVWKAWTLVSDGRELSDPRQLLHDAGVRSGSTITFAPRRRSRNRDRVPRPSTKRRTLHPKQ